MKAENISRIEQKIGYVFNDKNLLKVCFSHSSYSNEHGGENNERLEFLGDALLGALVAQYLYRNSHDDEGKMTEKRKALVAAAPLKTAIERMGLQKYILAGGDGKNIGEKAISSLFEAIVAGIYLDGGVDAAQKFITDKLLSVTDTHDNNYKGRLQEFLQYRKLENARYELVEKSGEEHAPVFTVRVYAASVIGEGSGKRQRDAEHAAAKDALSKIENRHGENKGH